MRVRAQKNNKRRDPVKFRMTSLVVLVLTCYASAFMLHSRHSLILKKKYHAMKRRDLLAAKTKRKKTRKRPERHSNSRKFEHSNGMQAYVLDTRRIIIMEKAGKLHNTHHGRKLLKEFREAYNVSWPIFKELVVACKKYYHYTHGRPPQHKDACGRQTIPFEAKCLACVCVLARGDSFKTTADALWCHSRTIQKHFVMGLEILAP